MKLQRRHFLQLASLAGTMGLAKPLAFGALGTGPVRDVSTLLPPLPAPFPVDPELNYFSAHQREVLTALADAALPGSGALGAARFIEQILTAFDFSPPRIFHDGVDFIPLNRMQEKAWRLRIYGSKGVGGGVNDSVLGEIVGLRDEIGEIFVQADKLLLGETYPFSTTLVSSVWASLAVALQQRVVELAVQSTVGHPAYGGNLNREGWKLIYFEGDSLPAGYSRYDAATQTQVERADAPLSGPNPGADPMPVSWITASLLDANANASTNANRRGK